MSIIVRQAKDMLVSGKSVTEPAYSLGFDYSSHFGRFFKRVEDMTPSEYVKGTKKIPQDRCKRTEHDSTCVMD